MRVFTDVQKATVYRSAQLGVEVTLKPGLNDIDDEDLAREMILRGVAKQVPVENPLVTAKNEDGSPKTGPEHEPQFAAEGQGLRGDIEAAKRSGVIDRSSVLAHTSVANVEAEAELEEERKGAEGEDTTDKDGVHHPSIRTTPIVGTEAAHRTDLTPEEVHTEIQRRALGITPATQKGMGDRRALAQRRGASRPAPKRGAAAPSSKSKKKGKSAPKRSSSSRRE